MMLTINQKRAAIAAYCKRQGSLTVHDLDTAGDDRIDALFKAFGLAGEQFNAHEADSPEFVLNKGGATDHDRYRGYRVNQACYDLEFEEEAKRTGKPRDGIRERVISNMAGRRGFDFYDLLQDDDATLLANYNDFLAEEATDKRNTR